MNITPELKKLLLDNAAAQVAFANGEDREYEASLRGKVWTATAHPMNKHTLTSPSTSWHRIKPAPKLRPFTLEEAHRLVGRVVREKERKDIVRMLVSCWCAVSGSVAFGTVSINIPVEKLLSDFELFNNVTGEWGPAGMEE